MVHLIDQESHGCRSDAETSKTFDMVVVLRECVREAQDSVYDQCDPNRFHEPRKQHLHPAERLKEHRPFPRSSPTEVLPSGAAAPLPSRATASLLLSLLPAWGVRGYVRGCVASEQPLASGSRTTFVDSRSSKKFEPEYHPNTIISIDDRKENLLFRGHL